MGNLKQQGYRLMVNCALQHAAWTHPAEVSGLTGYTDCTDMDDREFAAFMRGKHAEATPA